jgi:site-specific DNA recombinase
MLVQGYLRVSTAQQVKDGEGLAAQRARIEGWATFQGLPSPVFASDEGVSGSTVDGREGFKGALRAVLGAAEAGGGAVLVVAALDRLGRSMVDALEVAEVLEDAGVRLVTLDGIDTASAMGRQSLKALLSVKAMVADMERDAIVSRLQGGRTHARDRGRMYTSEAPFGRRTVGQSTRGGCKGLALESNPDEERAIARVRELRAGGVSYRSIAATLEAEGMRPRRGSRWSLALLHQIATGKRAPAPKKQSARVARARAALLSPEATA